MSSRKHIDFIFTTFDNQKVQQFLDENPTVDLTQLKDEKGSNILHQTAFQGKLNLMKLYLEHMRRLFEKEYWNSTSQYKKSVKQAIQSWVNEANNDGFTPVHYASYKGNVEMIKFLENLGASILVQNKAGLNVLHLAAQGDRMQSMIYLYDRFELNCVDLKNGTPLHWACYMGSENVAAFLLAQPSVQIDVFNSQEQTPLHLAVMYGNTNIVRRLLLKGADRTLRNEKDEKPIDIAKASQFRNISRMLNDDYSCTDQIRFYYNIKLQYRPSSRSYLKSILLLLGILFTSLTSHALPIPDFDQYYLGGPALFYLIFLIIFISLILPPKTLSNPKSYKQLIDNLPICSQCRIPYLRRSYHCDTCKVCVAQYDHHCPWINNCVGKKNIGRFMIFLVMLIIGMLEISLVSGCNLIECPLIKPQFRYADTKSLVNFYKVIFVCNIVLCLTFLPPVFILFFVQTKNLCLGQTTFQRFSGRNKKVTSTSIKDSMNSSISNPEKEVLMNKLQTKVDSTSCSLSNCIEMCRDDPQPIDKSQVR